MFATLRGTAGHACPRGSTRRPSIGYAPRSPTGPPAAGLSATEVGALIGISRVTARRYLEYLADVGPGGPQPPLRHPRPPRGRIPTPLSDPAPRPRPASWPRPAPPAPPRPRPAPAPRRRPIVKIRATSLLLRLRHA